MLHLLSLSLSIISVFHFSGVQSFYNHTKTCFFQKNSEVIWNVTFTDDKPPDMNDPKIVMQTKGRRYGATWKSLKKCQRGRKWIQCEIESNPLRHRYHLRIVRESTNAETSKYLMRESPGKGHYQNGFLCHPNHDKDSEFVRNLTLSNITSDGADVSWMFYEWDIDMVHLRWVRIYVLDAENRPYTKLDVSLEENTPLLYTRRVIGLIPCARYTIRVQGHYDTNEDRFLIVPVVTKCRARQEKIFMDVTVNDMVIVATSCVFLLVAVIFLLCYFFKRRRRGRRHLLRRVDSKDILDPRDIGLWPT